MFFPLLASSINHCSRHCKKIDDDRKIDTEAGAFMALIRNPTPKMKIDIFHLHVDQFFSANAKMYSVFWPKKI